METTSSGRSGSGSMVLYRHANELLFIWRNAACI